jgi:hypothetical protein
MFCRWLEKQGIFFHSIPNGGNRDEIEARRLKDEGLQAGIPDLFIPGFRLYVEMKRRKGGTVSQKQKEKMAILEGLGYDCIVCRGAKEAVEKTSKYL